MVTFTDVFFVDSSMSREDQVNELLQSMIEVLGPMPKRFLQRWRGRSSVVDEDGKLLQKHIEDPLSISLHDEISEQKPPFWSSETASAFEDFIRMMLQFEPDNRPSTEELIQHPWLNNPD